MDLLSDISHLAEVERILLVRDFFQDAYAGKIDQTITPGAECAIEFVLRKREHIVALEIETDSKQNPNTSVTSTPAYTTTENHPNVKQDCSPPTDDLYQQAANLVDANKIDEAIQVLEKLVITNTDNALAHNDLGVLYQRIGKPEKSRHHHEIASQLQPAHEVFQKNLADLLYREFGALEEALTIYVRLYGQNCYDVETIRAIDNICLEVDKPEDARFFLEQILAITPWDQDAADTLSSLPMEA
jgi:tetratricopeptide (TPR) repeat protein